MGTIYRIRHIPTKRLLSTPFEFYSPAQAFIETTIIYSASEYRVEPMRVPCDCHPLAPIAMSRCCRAIAYTVKPLSDVGTCMSCWTEGPVDQQCGSCSAWLVNADGDAALAAEHDVTQRATALLEQQPRGRGMIVNDPFGACPGCGSMIGEDRMLEHGRRCGPLRALAVKTAVQTEAATAANPGA